MFLTAYEIEELTGYKKPSSQAKWLWSNGIRNYTNAQGRVIVVKSDVEHPQQQVKGAEPRFDNVA